MNYISTRDKTRSVPSAFAITNGISAEGGLFVPECFPQLDGEVLTKLSHLSYVERAKAILADYLTDFTPEELYGCVSGAYTEAKFGDESITRISKLDNAYLMELWHGPTCAFKDMALQLLPRLLTVSAKKLGETDEIVILVATSGDTGKAALDGFSGAEGTRILVFYPEQGVSEMQRLQMATQEGANVGVCAIRGNFDDAQTAVKQIFTDASLSAALARKGMRFSSANSINWGRLAPQIVYYISAYCDLLSGEEIALGDEINVCVPTGNFGNILAAYYAKRMGLPIRRLLCASNENNVLTDFIRTGTYDKNRPFHTTLSPSMDILLSSNLERLLFALYGNDDAAVRGLMESLGASGSYTVSDEVKATLGREFYGGDCDDDATKATIKRLFETYSYVCDTHTAVAYAVYENYVRETGDDTRTVIASTANPYKFPASVLQALTGETQDAPEFVQAGLLERLTGMPMPQSLAELQKKTPRFTDVCDRESIRAYVERCLSV